MTRRYRRGLTWLALATVSGALWAVSPLQPLAKEALGALKAREDNRAASVASYLGGIKATFGLKASDDIREVRRSTDEFGKTHVRFVQTYQGTPVWASGLLGHLDAYGTPEPVQAKVFPDINLETADLLTREEVQHYSLQRLGITETKLPVLVDKIVFPTRFQDGLKLRRNADGQLVIDESYSVATARKPQPYVWAYHVVVREGQVGEGACTEMILDGTTGQVLKKWDGRTYDTPAVGHSQYNGTVNLSTNPFDWVNGWQDSWGPNLMPPSGTYATLRDTTRTMNHNPIWATSAPYMDVPGIATYWADNYYATSLNNNSVPFLNAGTEWGDGMPFAGFAAGNQAVTIATANLTVNGQTVAVDATYGVVSTWDFFKNVFGREGMDGQGTPPAVFVHVNNGFYQSMTPMLNAYFVSYNQSMYFGDGDLSQGYGPFASMDVTAHEMGHGIVAASGDLFNGYEPGGINEATADVFSAMTRFYFWGPNQGTGSTIPDTAPHAPLEDAVWTTGRQITQDHSAIRTMYKPSLDGYSYDQWFDGMYLDDVHFTMGPGNRAFYFLAQGASTTKGDLTYSPLLPGGMAGIGNDKAARIWFRAITTKLADPHMDYQGLRTILIETAAELFGEGGTEVTAVKNAFAAVNVGASAGGTEPVLVSIPPQIEVGDDDGGVAWHSVTNGFVIVPMTGVAQVLPVPTIARATDLEYTWSLGGLSKAVVNLGGKIIDGKSFIAPGLNKKFFGLKVTSHQDPNQFAATVAYVCNMDTNSDTEFDALDLAAYALSWGRFTAASPSSAVPLVDVTDNSWVDDNDILMAREAFTKSFNH